MSKTKSKTKYERGKIQFHPDKLIKILPIFKSALVSYSGVSFDGLDFVSTFFELREMIDRFTPQKPNGEWGPSYSSCPRCPCCGARVRPGKTQYSPVRDDHCRKCGQLIDWNDK